jgi:dTDP-4-amino-4,6-dideoxygalactose transaminase
MLQNDVIISYDGWERDFSQNKAGYVNAIANSLADPIGTVAELERNIAAFTGRQHAIACASATDALMFSLIANNIGPGDEVIVTNFSFISSSSCISMVGATPVFCDIDVDSYHLSYDSVKRMISSKTKALIYTHLFGNMSDTMRIQDLCAQRGIVFIEDSAQSLGSSLCGIKAGSIGKCSVISFNSNKVIAGLAGGGVLLTDDDSIDQLTRKLRIHGGSAANFEVLGKNSKIHPSNAAVINVRLHHISRWQLTRQIIADQYYSELKHLPIIFQQPVDGQEHNYHKFVIRVPTKDIRDRIRHNIHAQVHYERPLSHNTMYDNIQHRADECPNTTIVCETVVSLPIHPWLRDSEIETIIKNIKRSI